MLAAFPLQVLATCGLFVVVMSALIPIVKGPLVSFVVELVIANSMLPGHVLVIHVDDSGW